MNTTVLFQQIVSLSLLGTVLVIGILLIKLILRPKLSAAWHYYIWLALVLRLIIPLTPATPFSIANFIPQNQQTIILPQSSTPASSGGQAANQTPGRTAASGLNPANTSAPNPDTGRGTSIFARPAGNWGNWGWNWKTAAYIWLSGILAILLYILVVNGLMFLNTRKRLTCQDQNVQELLAECRSNLHVQSKIDLIYDTAVKSPALFGLFRPKIIISPALISQLSPEELRCIFFHEVSHIKRHDLWSNLLVTFIQVIYWFNPLIWYALHTMKQDCEMACDGTALTALKLDDRKKYGQTIISLLQLISKPHWALGTLGFANKFNRRRIMMITSGKKTSLKWAVVALALLLLAGCSSISNTPSTNQGNGQNQQGTTSNTTPGTNSNTTPNTTGDSSGSVVYHNTQYGFNFSLPQSWKGYTIINSSWTGNDTKTGRITATGPEISIRNPRWTSANPYQDIPIMVLTLDQWNSLKQGNGNMHIGAAPIDPGELGRNTSYVFALPARYNYAFPSGYQEVESILANKPLQPTQPAQAGQATDPVVLQLLNMAQLASAGQVINDDKFPAKTSNYGSVENAWGKADQTTYVAAAKGTYATYSSRHLVFGFNKGMQIFEVRSFDPALKSITLAKVKAVLGTPAYNKTINGQQIIGYPEGREFKLEFVFSQATAGNSDPSLDHYNVLYPQGTVNSMADDPGRQW